MANDFSGDSAIQAQWRFESGALGTDSKGANTLTNHNGATEDTADKKEGVCCVNLARASSQYYSITDANLGANFPLKNGDATKKGTIAVWFKATTVATNYFTICGKWDNANSKVSLSVNIHAGKIRIQWGYGTGTSNEYWEPFSVVTARWYHLGVIFDGVAKTCYVILLDDSTGITSVAKKTFTNELRVVDTDWTVGAETGAVNCFDGRLDELVISNDCKSADIIGRIRAGTYSGTGIDLAVSQLWADVLYKKAPKLKASQVLVQVEWLPTDPNVHLYNGNIPISTTPSSTHSIIWTKPGNVTIGVTPAAEYFFTPPGVFEYHGQVGITAAPASVRARGFVSHETAVPVNIVPSSDAFCPVRIYESQGVPIVIEPAGIYRIPTIGWDIPSGYGCVDFTDLQDTPPFWCVDTEGVSFAFDNTADKFELYAEYDIDLSDGVTVGGECDFAFSEPGITEITLLGGIRVAGSFHIECPEPWVTRLDTQGGVWVQGGLEITIVTPSTTLITEVTTKGGITVTGSPDYSAVDPADLVTAFDLQGGVVVGGRRYSPIEFLEPDTEHIYYEFDLQGGVSVGGESEFNIPVPGVYEFSVRRGGVRVGGDCTFGFWQPPVTEFDLMGGVFIEGSIIEDLDLYETWSLTGFSYSPSMYSGFNFNSYADRNGQILAARDDGIYLLEGDDDNGRPIHDGLRLGPTNFGVDNLKGTRAIYPGDAGTPEAHVIAETKGREGYFKLQRDRFNVSSDILDRLMTIEIADFEKLSHFEIIPVVRVKR